MAQHHATRFSSGKIFQILLQVLTDAAEPGCMINITLVLINQVVPDLDCAFGDDDNTKIRSTQIARANFFRDGLSEKGISGINITSAPPAMPE